MINLFTTYYTDKDPDRHKEIETCLLKNIENSLIDHIVIVTEENNLNENIIRNEKVIHCFINRRPTFNDFFYVINKCDLGFPVDNSLNIIANSDIYFDDSLNIANDHVGNNDVYALTRYDDLHEGVKFLNRWDSQDSWMLRGKAKPIHAEFTMGFPGCDNKLAYLFHKAGYKVTNPSLTIKSYHLHNSNVRNYNTTSRLPEPYKLLTPTA